MAIVNVRGSFADSDGAPATGSVTFELSSALVDPTGEVISSTAPIYETLVSGFFSTNLVSNDDQTLMPSNTYYTVTESIDGAQRRRYKVVIPSSAAAEGLDISTLTPVTPGDPVYDYASNALVLGINERVKRVEETTSGSRVPHRYYGDGPPSVVIGSVVGDEYVDRLTMTLYVLDA